MTNARTILKSFLGLPLLALACSSGPEPGETGGEPSSLSRQSACEQTLCDKMHEDCMSYIDECFGECYSMSYEFAYQCVSVCSNHQCSECTGNECAERSYSFEIAAPRDEDVFAACERARANVKSCGGDTSTFDCDRFSRLERPEVVAAYACYANLSCEADSTSCEPAPTTWGMDFCLALNARCSYDGFGCTAEEADQLNLGAAWLKDDVRAQAMACIEEDSCSDVAACVNAWLGVVFP